MFLVKVAGFAARERDSGADIRRRQSVSET
jgi:hypothetical protein